jgi:hypothetical protein
MGKHHGEVARYKDILDFSHGMWKRLSTDLKDKTSSVVVWERCLRLKKLTSITV